MRKLLAVITIISLLTLLSACQKQADEQYREGANPSHPSSFVTRQGFYALLDKESTGRLMPSGRVVSAVAPHHLVAGQLIVEIMQVLARENPELIIVLGPNHSNMGGKVITGFYDWQTPEGKVLAEGKVVQALIDKGLAVKDEEVLSREHSVGTHMPFIRHFMPEAKVVPIILHHDVTLQEVDRLLAVLEPHLNDRTVILASVDFSHYLKRQEAEAKDRETLALMEAFDYSSIFRLGNDYLDSPASLAFAFRLAQREGIGDFTLLGNTNSGIIMQNDIMETTSYFTLVFAKK